MILEITDQNFEDAVIKSDLPVALDFWPVVRTMQYDCTDN